jgi:hypothetical protein
MLTSAASETAHESMGSMPAMSSMSNAFHFGVGNTLGTALLTPANGQGYAGAIILLIFMAFFLRFLKTLRGMTEKRWNLQRRPFRSNFGDADVSREDEAKVDAGYRWNTSIQFTRALFELTAMTVGYLLLVSLVSLERH